MASTPPPQPPAPPAHPQPAPPAPTPPQRRTSPWVWVAAGCGGILIVVILAVVVGGYFVARKAKEFAAEIHENPALAAVKAAVAFNPEIELVESESTDDVIVVRNVRTGETFTVDLAEVEEGRIRFRNSDGETISLVAGDDGEGTAFRVESETGSFRLGGGQGEIPEWVPRYPGSDVKGSLTNSSDDRSEGGFAFTTSDSVDDVLEFYKSELEQAGLSVTTNTFEQDGKARGGLVNGTTDDRSRTCTVTVTRVEETTSVAVSYRSAPPG